MLPTDYFTDQPIDFSALEADGDLVPGGMREVDSRWLYVTEDSQEIEMPEPYKPPTLDDLYPDTPQPILRLQQLCQQGYRELNRAKAFHHQAMVMKDFNDSAEQVPFSAYYPVYASMTIPQMRSYFSLRHRLRQGHHPDMHKSYLYVYIYETLMLIPDLTPTEAIDTLLDLRQAYGGDDSRLRNYLITWAQDLAAYHGVEPVPQGLFDQDATEEEWYMALSSQSFQSSQPSQQSQNSQSSQQPDPSRLFELLQLHRVNPLYRSVLMKYHSEETHEAVAAVVHGIGAAFEERFKMPMANALCGTMVARLHTMFEGAMVYHPDPVLHAVYRATPLRHYRCTDGLWERIVLEGNPSPLHVNWLKDVLRETDCQLRHALKVRSKVASRMTDQPLRALIHKLLQDWLRQRAEANRPRLEVDFSKLDGIRTDASAIRQALLVEEEDANPSTPPEAVGNTTENHIGAAGNTIENHIDTAGNTVENHIEAEGNTLGAGFIPHPFGPQGRQQNPDTLIQGAATADPSSKDADISKDAGINPSPFSPAEQALLRALLAGTPWRDAIAPYHTPVGVLMETINEKMLDELGDTLLTDDGQGPEIIPDYLDDLKAMLG